MATIKCNHRAGAPRTALRLFTATLAFGAGSGAATLHVDADAPPGGDGTSWATALHDLRDALAAATPGDSIWVAEGVYRPDAATGLRFMSFELRAGVTMLGGFEGDETSASQRDPAGNPTVLSGDLAGNDAGGVVGANAENSFHVLRAILLGAPSTVDGFTIAGGNAGGFASYSRGGGLYALESSVVFVGCRIESCAATDSGGGAYVSGGSLTMHDGRVSSCTALIGGGLRAQGAEVVLVNTVLEACTAVDGGGAHVVQGSLTFAGGEVRGNATTQTHGGGVRAIDAPVILSSLAVRDNITPPTGADGAGIHVGGAASSIVAVGCVFERNNGGRGAAVSTATSGAFQGCVFRDQVGRDGAAISTEGAAAELEVHGCLFERNIGTGNGGAIRCLGGSATITGCIFNENYASATGGAVMLAGAGAIEACEFHGNISVGGAGVYLGHGGFAVRGCAFTLNEATQGGGIRIDPQAQPWSPTVIEGCSFEGNEAHFGGALMVSTTATTVRHCAFVANGADFAGALHLAAAAAQWPQSVIVDCDFIENLAVTNGAGAIYLTGGAPTVVSCRLLGNVAAGTMSFDGGAIEVNGGQPTIANCALSGNVGANNGALVARGGANVSILSCTIAGNSATGLPGGFSAGGGVYAHGATTIGLANCILWGNGGESQADQLDAGVNGLVAPTACCVQGWTGGLGGAGNFGADPLFLAPLGRDGVAGTLDDDLHLGAGSPCIDTGDAGLLPPDTGDVDGNGDIDEDIPLDLDGATRLVGMLDCGCHESQVRPARRPFGVRLLPGTAVRAPKAR